MTVLRQSPRTYIVDTDGGFDDLMALCALAISCESVALVTCCFGIGGTPVRVAARVRSALRRVGSTAPVAVGAAEPLGCSRAAAAGRHSAWSLGMQQSLDAWCLEQKLDVDDKDDAPAAEDALVAALEAAEDGSVDLVTVGPLTNLARWDANETVSSTIDSKVRRIWAMGGTVSAPGNTPVGTEYNFYADPVAAAAVLGSQTLGTKVRLLGLDVCNANDGRFPAWAAHVTALPGLIPSTQRADENALVYDPVAAFAAAVDGDGFEWTALGALDVDRETGALRPGHGAPAAPPVLTATAFPARPNLLAWLEAAIDLERRQVQQANKEPRRR